MRSCVDKILFLEKAGVTAHVENKNKTKIGLDWAAMNVWVEKNGTYTGPGKRNSGQK
jgi:hypothetical protein